jgi:hypothetical protein
LPDRYRVGILDNAAKRLRAGRSIRGAEFESAGKIVYQFQTEDLPVTRPERLSERVGDNAYIDNLKEIGHCFSEPDQAGFINCPVSRREG